MPGLNGQLRLSVLLIFIAALADRFDGMAARKLQIESELGKQLDSMSDIISFRCSARFIIISRNFIFVWFSRHIFHYFLYRLRSIPSCQI